MPQPMKLPSEKELSRATEAFDGEWGHVDEILYGICHRYPGQNERRSLAAKLILIDRAYAAGLERLITPPKGEQAMSLIVDFVLAYDGEFDDLITELAALQEPLDAAVMERIVVTHGQLTELLQQLTDDQKAPRSFVAKYLHFHNPVVPIYDSRASEHLAKHVRWETHQIPFERPPEGDAEYWEFCVRFFRLYDACRQAGLAVTVKSLDQYLWQNTA